MAWNNALKRMEYFYKKIRMCFLNLETYKIRKCRDNGIKTVNSIRTPVTFNEKLINQMIYGNDNRIGFLSNKLGARGYVSKKIGSEYLVPLLGVYKSVREINFDLMPDSFVLKCNHDSGSAIVVKNKHEIDNLSLCSRFALAQSKNLYYVTCESQYKKIAPLVMCEQLIAKRGNSLTDVVRVHCFHGCACFYEVDIIDSHGNEYINLYDSSFKYVDVQIDRYGNYKGYDFSCGIPSNIKELSEKLSESFEYCRVDWLVSGDKLYFSEITFTPYAGCMKFTPDKYDYVFGELW
ncbi:glycosyltransferase [Enterobacter bugandensis]|uniref:Glycosyltransferase n=1 Tax=Enterobacter bugandensis TaxID=881260 RepID=A0AA42PVK8_9ENTR|nr:ATP-grasp fold amidoligase family protein [Enterobacter bugandensis]MDH1321597.1 glycosyltransferase [Enterobacter bugandensis]